jgi:hypothetical protein
MKACSRTFAATLLLGVFATVAAAQELGRVHFQTSCTPQAQQKFDAASRSPGRALYRVNTGEHNERRLQWVSM